jgi:hypothetical protein
LTVNYYLHAGRDLGLMCISHMRKRRRIRGDGKKEREGICGDWSQRFEPNLPLSEPNLKIVEGGISGKFDACTMGLPMTRDRKFAGAGQTHKQWKADSASIEHALQVGLGLSPILWRWLFRQQCPVISETKILSLFLDMTQTYDSCPQKVDTDPCLVSSSALSFPKISLSPGTQKSLTPLAIERFCNESQHCDTKEEEIV